MRRFRQRSDKLETRLHDEKPQPSDELVRRISGDARASRVRRAPRLGLALALSSVVVLGFAVTGGIGYAASAANNGTSALKHLVAPKDDGTNGNPKAQGSTAKVNNTDTSTGNGNNDSSSGGEANAKQGGSDNSADDQYGGKVVICHIPPGNPGNAHTIMVGQAAVPAHLAHGDHLGAC